VFSGGADDFKRWAVSTHGVGKTIFTWLRVWITLEAEPFLFSVSYQLKKAIKEALLAGWAWINLKCFFKF